MGVSIASTTARPRPEAAPYFSTRLTSGLMRSSFLAYSKIPLRFSGKLGRRLTYLASIRAPSVGPKVFVNQAVCSGRVMLEKKAEGGNPLIVLRFHCGEDVADEEL